MERLAVDVDRSVCIGSGMCALRVPEVFGSSPDDGLAVVLDPTPASPQHARVLQAEEECPVGAITIVRPA